MIKLLTLSKLTIAHYLPIFEIDGHKVGPVPSDFPCMIETLKTGCDIKDEKLREQLITSGLITASENGVCVETDKLKASRDELINLFNTKYRFENVSNQPKAKAKSKPAKPAKAAKVKPAKVKAVAKPKAAKAAKPSP